MERSIICRRAIQIFGLALVLMTAETARGAITVFDTFGVGNAYDTGTRYGVDGNGTFQAFLFVPTTSGTLSDITVALGRSSATTLFTQFNLYAGTPTALGALLESNVVPNSVPCNSKGQRPRFPKTPRKTLNTNNSSTCLMPPKY